MKWTVVAFALLVPAASYAFVPTQTCTESGEYKCRAGEEPKPVRWKSLCTNWYLNDKGTFRIPAGPDGLVSDALEQTIVTSFDAWNQV